jgi:Zn2+/Cd2+-exporting ATPase
VPARDAKRGRLGSQSDRRQAILGRRQLLVDLGVDAVSEDDGDVSQVWVAYGGQCLGCLALRDQPRAEARDALAAMRALGIGRLVLLTGDRAAVAREVGQILGMDEVVAEVLPA